MFSKFISVGEIGDCIHADGKTVVHRDRRKIQERGWIRGRFLERYTPSICKGEAGETPSDNFCMLHDVEGQASTKNGESEVAGRVDDLNK